MAGDRKKEKLAIMRRMIIRFFTVNPQRGSSRELLEGCSRLFFGDIIS